MRVDRIGAPSTIRRQSYRFAAPLRTERAPSPALLRGAPSPPRGRGHKAGRGAADRTFQGRCALLAATIVLNLFPALAQTPAELRQRGIQAFQAGQFAAAEHLFSQLAKEEPSAAAFNYLAAAEGSAGKFGLAINDFKRSIQLGNDTPYLRYDLALAYLKEHQPAAGIRELQVALARQPDFAQARYTLGVALLRTNRPHEALINLGRLRTQLARSPGMWANLVHAQFATGDPNEALKTIDAATDALPNDRQMPLALASLCVRYAEPGKARELLENAVAAAPHDQPLKLLLAQASLKAEEPLEALAVLKEVPSGAGQPGQVAFLKGSALMLEGKLREAEPLIASAVAAAPPNMEYLSTYAEIETFQKNYGGALATLSRMQRREPGNAEFRYQTALVYTSMHRYTDAEIACKQATGLNPKFDQAYFLLGAIALDGGAPITAEGAFHRAAALRPASPLYHSALGAALLMSGRLVESKNELDHALLLDPQTTSAYYWRARLWARQGLPEKAIQDLETFIALDPNYPDAYRQVAHLYTEQGQSGKASAANAKYAAEKKSRHEKGPFFLDQLGMTRLHQIRGSSR
jgi:predicted Zn-dependent protease